MCVALIHVRSYDVRVSKGIFQWFIVKCECESILKIELGKICNQMATQDQKSIPPVNQENDIPARQNAPRWVWLNIAGLVIIFILIGVGLFGRNLSSSSTQKPTSQAGVQVTAPPEKPTPEYPVSEADGAELAFVNEGEFLMGSNPEQDSYFYGVEGPLHHVFLYSFWIYRTEVTNAMYQECVQQGACSNLRFNNSFTRDDYYGNSLYDNYPVVFVSWSDASTYCAWAGGRLPSEAEWEKAARGEDGRLFPWGNNPPTGDQVNYCDINCLENMRDPSRDDGFGDTAPVGSYPNGSSPYGTLDMAGNVSEWTQDWFQASYYSYSPSENPQGPGSGTQRAIRGGSISDRVEGIRTVVRRSDVPNTRLANLGFRCVVDIP